MPYYGRITEAGIGGPKEGAHQKAWAATKPTKAKAARSQQMTRIDPRSAPPAQKSAQDQQSQLGNVPGMAAKDISRILPRYDAEATTMPDPQDAPPPGINGNGTMDGGAELDLVDAFTVGAELAAQAEEAEACAWTVTEAEAQMIQMELDAEARKKRRFWELLLAVGGGFMLGKMWQG